MHLYQHLLEFCMSHPKVKQKDIENITHSFCDDYFVKNFI